MSQTRWAVDGPDGTSLELKGRKYSSNDDGAPMMCNLVCLAMGRHVHVDYCRAEDGAPCDGADVLHIPTRMIPDPSRLKDFVTHNLHWRRTGTFLYFEVVCYTKLISFQASRVCFQTEQLLFLPFSVSHQCTDPYPRDDQANFAKWYAPSSLTLHLDLNHTLQ
jgi:hypothetical protein